MNSITVSVCVAGVGGVSFAYLYARSRCKLCNISMEVPALDDPPIPVAEEDNARQKHIMMMMTTSMIFSLAKGLGLYISSCGRIPTKWMQLAGFGNDICFMPFPKKISFSSSRTQLLLSSTFSIKDFCRRRWNRGTNFEKSRRLFIMTHILSNTCSWQKRVVEEDEEALTTYFIGPFLFKREGALESLQSLQFDA